METSSYQAEVAERRLQRGIMPMALGGGESGYDGGGGGGGGGGGRGRHDGEQRSGVATVVAMDPSAQTCRFVPHRLATLRCMVPKVLVSRL